MIKIFSSSTHSEHAPPYSVFEGGVRYQYFECPERLLQVLRAFSKASWAKIEEPRDFGLAPILAVHDQGYIDYVQSAYEKWLKLGGELGPKRLADVLTPGTFLMRRSNANRPRSFPGEMGYYSTDTHSPIVAGTFSAAQAAANCAVSAAKALVDGSPVAFSMARPPGHHAGRDFSGGFCYFNNAAIAAKYLSKKFRVALLDIDFHAANGTQDIFYDSPEVLTISIHGDPLDTYPYFVGYAEETGSGEGKGYHRNFPMAAGTGDKEYLETLNQAVNLIENFAPTALVITAGMDILENDPLGNFKVTISGIQKIGEKIAALKLPTLICMEGGYNHEDLGNGFLKLVECFT